MEWLKKIFNSTNGTLHSVLLIVLGVSLMFNFPGNEFIAIITGVISLVGLIREWARKGVKFEWKSNALAYILAGLSALFPKLAELFGAGGDLLDAIVSGNIAVIVPALILFVNILIQSLKKKEPAPANT